MRETFSSLILFQVRDHGLDGVDSSMPYTTLWEVGKGVGVLLDFLAQVPDHALKSPLRGADRRANVNNFTWQVHYWVNARMYEMDASGWVLTIDYLEFMGE
jgi:hypothetical protein